MEEMAMVVMMTVVMMGMLRSSSRGISIAMLLYSCVSPYSQLPFEVTRKPHKKLKRGIGARGKGYGLGLALGDGCWVRSGSRGGVGVRACV